MTARSVGSKQGQANGFATEERVVANGVTVTDGDFVKLLQGGTVTTATIGTGKLYGVAQGAGSANLTGRSYKTAAVGVADGSVTTLLELVDGMRYEIPVSASLASDAEGSYYNLTGATGAQTVDNTSKSATVGQLICRKRVATNAAGTQFLKGWFEVASPNSITTLT